MDRRRLQLNALRAFEDVAKHKSFRAAAEAMNVSQSALSRHVTALEQALGTGLFERLPHGLALTPAGTRLLAAVGKSFDRLSTTLDEIREGLPQPRNLRLYFAPSFASLLGVRALADFRRLCPDVTLDISSLSQPQQRGPQQRGPQQGGPQQGGPQQGGGEPDAAVIYGRPDVSDKISDLLWQVEDTMICRPEIAGTGTLTDRAMLDAVIEANELLHVWLPGENKYALWQNFARQHGLQADVARGLTFDTAELAVRYALSGEGIALIDPVPFRAEIAAGQLACPTPLKVSPGYGYYLVCDPEALEDPDIALFRSWLIGQFSQAANRPQD
jgi:LysR family glycine cleavage system transcriptional activator